MRIVLLLTLIGACRAPFPRISADGVPQILSFDADQSALTSGETLTLLASFDGDGEALLLPDGISIESDVPLEITPTIPNGEVFETRSYTLEITGSTTVRAQLNVTIHAAPEPLFITTVFFARINDRAQDASVEQQPGMNVGWEVSGNGALRSSANGSSILYDVGGEFEDVVLTATVSNAVGQSLSASVAVPVAGIRVRYGSLAKDVSTVRGPIALDELRLDTPSAMAFDDDMSLWAFSRGSYRLYRIGAADAELAVTPSGDCADGPLETASVQVVQHAAGFADGIIFAQFDAIRYLHGREISTLAHFDGAPSDCQSGTRIPTGSNFFGVSVHTSGHAYALVDGRQVLEFVGTDAPTFGAMFPADYGTSAGLAAEGTDASGEALIYLSDALGSLYRYRMSDPKPVLYVRGGAGANADGGIDEARFGAVSGLAAIEEGLLVIDGSNGALRLVRDDFVTTIAGPESLLTLPALDTGTLLAHAARVLRTGPTRFLVTYDSGDYIAELELPPDAFTFARPPSP